MKDIKILLLLLIPYCGVCQSPAAGAAEKSMANDKYSAPTAAMTETFTARTVDEPQVSTFQQRGIQKLQDFYNYLTIISNPTYDKKLRLDAKNQAKQLFYAATCKVNGAFATGFIDSCFDISKKIEWKAVDVAIFQNMANSDESDTTYHGELSFKESKDGVVSALKRAYIVLSKAEKQFGNTKREVWTVYICSIE